MPDNFLIYAIVFAAVVAVLWVAWKIALSAGLAEREKLESSLSDSEKETADLQRRQQEAEQAERNREAYEEVMKAEIFFGIFIKGIKTYIPYIKVFIYTWTFFLWRFYII